MNIVFTLCSNNYLAQAKTLMDSVHKFSPETILVIGLVDELHKEIDYNFFDPAIVLPVKEIGLPNLEELCLKYNIIELNTAVKASYFKYLCNRFDSKNIVYFDPDIQVYEPLDSLFAQLISNDIILTPHILSPIPHDGLKPQENIFLNYGIYNLGFIGLNPRTSNVLKFLDWWEERTLSLGFNRVHEGLFVDQLWINLVPLLFKKIKILTEYGYNMAPWNLHERVLIKYVDEGLLLNDNSNLTFYHFSSYDYRTPDSISKDFYNRFSFANRPDLVELYITYHSSLLRNKIMFFSNLGCSYVISPQLSKAQKLKKRSILNSFIRAVHRNISKSLYS